MKTENDLSPASFIKKEANTSQNTMFISNTTLTTVKKETYKSEDFFLPYKKNFRKNSQFSNQDELSFDAISFKNRKRSISYYDNFPKKVEKKSHFPKKKKKPEKKNFKCFCKCKNSNCLRLHCSCFKTLGYCNDFCKCKNCLNSETFKDARNFVIQKTKIIYKKAFKPKTVNIKEIGGVKINTDGCNCEKGCFNNYCGCKKINGNCSPICRCSGCKNNKIFLSKAEIQKIYKPCSRKKHKLIINFKDYKVFEEGGKNIVFETYRKGFCKK